MKKINLILIILSLLLLTIPVNAATDFVYTSPYNFEYVDDNLYQEGISETNTLMTIMNDDMTTELLTHSSGDYYSAIINDVQYEYYGIDFDTSYRTDLNNLSVQFPYHVLWPYFHQNNFQFIDIYWVIQINVESGIYQRSDISSLNFGFENEAQDPGSSYPDAFHPAFTRLPTEFIGETTGVTSINGDLDSTVYLFRSTISADELSYYFDYSDQIIFTVFFEDYFINPQSITIATLAGTIGYDKVYPLRPWDSGFHDDLHDDFVSHLSGVDLLDPSIIPGGGDFEFSSVTTSLVDTQIFRVLLSALAVSGCSILLTYFVLRKG